MKMTQLIDLSVTLQNRPGIQYGHGDPEITYMSHEESARERAEVYGLKPDDFNIRGGRYAAVERVSIGTHDTTHLDAPWHFGPTSEGKPAKKIDEVPLEWCYGDGVLLDFHHKKAGESISAGEVSGALDKIGYRLKPGDIVLIRTDAYKHYGESGYANIHPGMNRESTLWLIEHGIKTMGIDAWGWDRPHKVMADELKAGNKEQFWEAHYLGMEREYVHLERLANLDKIPRPFGFKVAAFPIKIAGASGSWVRAVAIIED